jgi:hypothetical protein
MDPAIAAAVSLVDAHSTSVAHQPGEWRPEHEADQKLAGLMTQWPGKESVGQFSTQFLLHRRHITSPLQSPPS